MQAAIDSGKEIPDRLLNAPELNPGSYFFWNAFIELNSCRDDGEIPWTAIDRYARRYKIDGELFEDLVETINALDDVLLNHKAKERGKGNGFK